MNPPPTASADAPALHVGLSPVEEPLVVGAPGAAMLVAALRVWWLGRAA